MRISLRMVVLVGLAICAASTVFPLDAMAAAAPMATSYDNGWQAVLAHVAVAATAVNIDELRGKVRSLTEAATKKLDELKDGLPDADVKRIEGEHDAMLRELDEINKQIADAEKGARTTLPATNNGGVLSQADLEGAAERAVAAERDRVNKITELGKRHNLVELAAEHVRIGTKLVAFRELFFEKLAARSNEGGNREGGNNAETGGGRLDETVTRRDAMVDYILARNNALDAKGQSIKMPEAAAALYRGMRAVDLIKEVLSWEGVKTRGLTPDEIAQRGLMSTSDFPNILANTASKTLRAAYEAAPRTFMSWTRNIQLPDFKAYNILRRGETPQLALLNEHGEYKRGSIKESKETIQLKTYGITVGMTRQLIINDDLGAMVGVPSDFGQSAATLESDLVYWLLLTNPTLLQDSVALFHATHNNLAASGTALDVAPLTVMRGKMAKQLGVDGKTVLNLFANYLLVPPELISKAEQLLASFYPATAGAQLPKGLKNLEPVSEARLSVGVTNVDAGLAAQAGSATAYYLISNQVDTIVTANLQGNDGPFVESRVGFTVDGVEIKCRHDFAASAADFRGMQKDPGA